MARPSIEQQVTFLATRDLEANAAFYEGALGLSLVLDQGTCRIYRTGGDAYLGFCNHLPAAAEPLEVIVTLVTQEVDAWYAHLSQKGVPAAEPPILNPIYNIYHFFFRDPDGYLIEMQQFLDPAWPAG